MTDAHLAHPCWYTGYGRAAQGDRGGQESPSLARAPAPEVSYNTVISTGENQGFL